ncbi:hypothetical protein C8T65DRAFT_666004, partial [Cerioporus squamosus]
MSDDATIISYYAAARVNYTTSIAVAALLLYDYLITFSSEVELFWTGASVTAAPLLFYTTRYLGLLSMVLDRVQAAPISHQYVPFYDSCDALVRASSFVNYLQDIPVGVFSGLRVFALSKGNIGVASIVFVLSLAPLGTNMSLFHMGLTGTIDPVHGCGASVKTLTLEKTIIRVLDTEGCATVATVTNTALILANTITIAVTWNTLGFKTFRGLLSRGMQGGFAAILLWNGSLFLLSVLSPRRLRGLIQVAFTSCTSLRSFAAA